jgi:hypothetical protein
MFDNVVGNFCRKSRNFRGVLSRGLILALVCTGLATFPNAALAQQGSFAFTGSPIGGPAGGGPPVLLNNGMVLIGLQLYNPATGTFTATGASDGSNFGTTATLLQNGMVLIAVQNNVKAELYDPTTGTFASTGNMITARIAATATLLHNGTVLIAGGGYSCGIGTSCPAPTAELYDPTASTFSPTGSPFYAHSAGTATLLNNGMVLLAGGDPQGPNDTLDPVILQATELYDPSKGIFSGASVTGLNTGRVNHTATLLNDGQVLIVGGEDINNHPLASAELFDPATGAFTFTGSMSTARVAQTATLLNNGQVLIVGGLDSNNNNLASAELYDPTTGTFAPTGSLNTAGEAQYATLLDNGTVLVTGGLKDTDSAELYELVGFAPASVSFPNQIINVKSASQNLTLTNSLSTALSITGITIGGTNASDFAETNNCPGSVPAGAGCSISVTFTPAAAGSRTGSLIITNTLPATDGPLQVLLSGTGIVPAPIVSLSTNGVDFATQAIGTTSAPQTVTLHNTGNASLSIQTVAGTGANAGDFAITNSSTCTNGSSVAINGSCTIQVTFTPTGNGERSATIGITDNAADSPEMISLSGSGPPPSGVVSLSPSTVSFSAQYVGTSGLPQTVTVTNTGNATLTITGVAASPADFGVLSNCSNPVAVNSSCTIGVFFDPTAGGTRTGTLTITDNAGNSPQTVALTGSGLDFSMTPGAAASATVTAGQTATYSIAVAPAGGFAASVALSCSGGPAGSACAVSPSTIALSGAAAQTAMVTVTTAAHGWLLPFRGGWPKDTRYRQTPMILTLAAMFLLMIVASQFLRREQNLVWIRVAGFAALVTLGLTLTSCGGGSGSGGGGTNPQAGTYTVTVTGNFTSGATTLNHSAKLTLVVQ